MILKVEERDRLLKKLTEEQQIFLSQQMTRSRRTAFANALIKQKGMYIPDDADPEDIETLLSDWVYTGYIDAGRVSPELKCECGRSLRYQHHVQHKVTGETKKFGIEHLKEHLDIDTAAVAAIKKGFDAIDYELDEILLKIENHWQIDPSLLQQNNLPEVILQHLKLGLPLLDRQINQLKQSRNKMISKPIEKESSFPKNGHQDILNWNSIEESKSAIGLELPIHLQNVTLDYLHRGIGSAIVICELLISEHHAQNKRFITGKPHLFVPVCMFIESLDNVNLKKRSTSDRIYEILST